MSTSQPLAFAGGRNIAMKVPPHLWEETVGFYRDVVGLTMLENPFDGGSPSVGFEFGANRLWIDRVVGFSQAEIWLELTSDDVAAAEEHLESSHRTTRDDSKCSGTSAFWISSPASIVHLVSRTEATRATES